MSDSTASLRKHLLNLLGKGEAHADASAVLRDFPAALRGRTPPGGPHTPWELLEHMRIGQSDILNFSVDPHHVSPQWPEGYWPESDTPPAPGAWDRSVEEFFADLHAMEKLVSDPATNLFSPIPHGAGQTFLREVLLVADHNSYHLGQIVMVRRILEGK